MRRLLPTLLVVATGALGAAASPAHAWSVTGYVQADGPGDAPLISAAATSVTDYGVDGATINADGASITVPPQNLADLAAARAAGKRASLLVSNYDDAIQDFSPALASKVLDDPGRRAAVVEALRAQIAGNGWNGLTLDLEALVPGDRAQLTAFVTQLKAALPKGTTIDIDVGAATDPTDPYVAAFDLKALAPLVDHVTLMAYDQHYGGGKAGPVAGMPWFKRAIGVATAQLPADKLRIGIAGYGYRWKKGKPTRNVTVKQAKKLAGRRAHWNKGQGEWSATLRDGSVMWWSDKRAVNQRIAYAKAVAAQGIAVWRLGSADSLPILPVPAPTPVPDPNPTPVCPAVGSASSLGAPAARAVFCPLATSAAADASCPCPGPVRAPA